MKIGKNCKKSPSFIVISSKSSCIFVADSVEKCYKDRKLYKNVSESLLELNQKFLCIFLLTVKHHHTQPTTTYEIYAKKRFVIQINWK